MLATTDSGEFYRLDATCFFYAPDFGWSISHAVQHDFVGAVVSLLRFDIRTACSVKTLDAIWACLTDSDRGRFYLPDLEEWMTTVARWMTSSDVPGNIFETGGRISVR